MDLFFLSLILGGFFYGFAAPLFSPIRVQSHGHDEFEALRANGMLEEDA